MTCGHCTADTADGITLCQRCQHTASIALVNTAAYHADLLRIRPGERVKAKATYQSAPPPNPEPGPDRTTIALVDVESTLVDYERKLLRDHPELADEAPGGRHQMAVRARAKITPPELPGVDVRYLCAWFEQRLPTIVTLDWATQLLRDVRHHERRLQRLIDQADTGWYAGVCGFELEPERAHDATTCGCACHHTDDTDCDVPGGCGTLARIPALTCLRGLYATPGTSWIRCPECGTTWDVTARRDQMIRETRDAAAPVSVIARSIVGWLDTETSVERLVKRIEKWVQRKQLHSTGTKVIAGQIVRTYRIGDVLDLVQRDTRAVRTEQVS